MQLNWKILKALEEFEALEGSGNPQSIDIGEFNLFRRFGRYYNMEFNTKKLWTDPDTGETEDFYDYHGVAGGESREDFISQMETALAMAEAFIKEFGDDYSPEADCDS